MTDGSPTILKSGTIETQEQAIRIVEDYCLKCVEARANCDIRVPDDPVTTARVQEAAYDEYQCWYGAAIGALTVLKYAKLIPDTAYEQLIQKVHHTRAATVVGLVRPAALRRG